MYVLEQFFKLVQLCAMNDPRSETLLTLRQRRVIKTVSTWKKSLCFFRFFCLYNLFLIVI
jgi:hypothetical protein